MQANNLHILQAPLYSKKKPTKFTVFHKKPTNHNILLPPIKGFLCPSGRVLVSFGRVQYRAGQTFKWQIIQNCRLLISRKCCSVPFLLRQHSSAGIGIWNNIRSEVVHSDRDIKRQWRFTSPSPFAKGQHAYQRAAITLGIGTHLVFLSSAAADKNNKKAQLSLTNPRDACEKFARFT